MPQKIPKICYIIPEFDPAARSHFFHLYTLLERASAAADIYVIAERGSHFPQAAPFGLYVQKFSWPPLRIAELLTVLCAKRVAGCTFFYTHYSFVGAVSSWVVTKIFGGSNMYWNCGMPWRYRRGWAEEKLFRFALRHSIFVTGTVGLRDEYLRNYGLKADFTRIMPNWVEVSRFRVREEKKKMRARLGIAKDAKVVLFVHRLSRRKGSHQILPIAERVTKKIPGVIFLIIGDGPDRANVESAIARRGLDKSVRVIGEVPNRDIHNYFGAADIFLMPSEEEGFPHVVLEAQASGIPYVASDVGGVREITPPELQNYVVDNSNTELFSKRIGELFGRSPAERKELGDAEKRWVMQYDAQAVLPQFIGLFAKQ